VSVYWSSTVVAKVAKYTVSKKSDRYG